MKTPTIFKNLLSKDDFDQLKAYVLDLDKEKLVFSKDFNRYEFGNTDIINSMHEKLLPVAKDFFGSQTLTKSFNFGSWYFGEASLEKHKDVAACTYTIDLCVYQKQPWDLYVEGIPYTLNENEALFYYGEDQKHWREEFPDPKNNIVCNIFFFYVEPEHWSILEKEEDHKRIKFENYVKRNLE